MTRKEFLEIRGDRSYSKCTVSEYICYLLTPFLSPYFINNGIKPNFVTLLMIFSGLIFGIILMIPNEWCKLISFFGYILWFVFDCSDGEVARITKTFSKYGKQLDWVAHLVCHPLFIIGIWLSLLQYYHDVNSYYISIFSLLLLSCELVHRCVVAMTDVNELGSQRTNNDNLKFSLLSWVKSQVAYFPNLVIFITLFLFIDIFFSLNYFIYIYIVWGSLYMIYSIKEFIIVCRLMYNS